MKFLSQTKHQFGLATVAVIFRNMIVALILTAAIYAYSQLDLRRLDKSQTMSGFSIDEQDVSRLLPILFSPSAALGD